MLFWPQLIEPPYEIGALPPALSVEAGAGGVGGVYLEIGGAAEALLLSVEAAEGAVGGVYVEVGGAAEALLLSVEAAEGGVGRVYVEVGSGAEALLPVGPEVGEPLYGGALDEPPEGGALDEPLDDGGDGVVVFVLVLPENLPAMHFVKSGWSFQVEPLLVGVRDRT